MNKARKAHLFVRGNITMRQATNASIRYGTSYSVLYSHLGSKFTPVDKMPRIQTPHSPGHPMQEHDPLTNHPPQNNMRSKRRIIIDNSSSSTEIISLGSTPHSPRVTRDSNQL